MNRGAHKLNVLLAQHGSKKRFADWIEVEPSILSHWLKGDRKPDTRQRARIEDEYAIGWRLWDEDIADDPAPQAATGTHGAGE